MKLDGNSLNYTEQFSKCILDCIERFAPVTENKPKENSADWYTNTMKMPLLNEINCFKTGKRRLVRTITNSTNNNKTWIHH